MSLTVHYEAVFLPYWIWYLNLYLNIVHRLHFCEKKPWFQGEIMYCFFYCWQELYEMESFHPPIRAAILTSEIKEMLCTPWNSETLMSHAVLSINFWLGTPVYNYYVPLYLICRSPGIQQHHTGWICFIFFHSMHFLIFQHVDSLCSLSYDRSIASSKASSPQTVLVFPLSTSSTLSFPCGHPVAAYVFFLVFPSLLAFPISFLQKHFLVGSLYSRCDQSS